MKPPLKTCDNCRFHQVHTVHRLWPGYETWDTFDGSRCHCPEAMKNHRIDKTGGARLGNFCHECKNKFWQPIETTANVAVVEKEARDRQISTLKQNGSSDVEIFPQREDEGRTRDKLGELAGVFA